MSNKKCCVPGCEDLEGVHRPLHLFPNPVKDPERFSTWVLSIGGDIVGLPNEFIYKYRRVCHAHFEDKFYCRFDRISNIAVPTLNLPGPLALPRFSLVRPPLRQVQNVQEIVPNEPENNENIPSTSKGPLALPRFSLVRPPLRRVQNVQEIVPNESENNENIPSTSKGPAPFPRILSISRPLREVQKMPEIIPSTSKGPVPLPRFSLIRAPSKELQNIQGMVPLTETVQSTPKDISGIVPHHDETIPPMVDIPPNVEETLKRNPFHKRTVITKRLPRTLAEQKLYKKLIKMRVRLSKFRSKVRKQMAHIKASKKIIAHPEFLKTLEELPSASKILTLMQLREMKKQHKGRRFTSQEKILALSIFKQSPKAYRFLRKLLILPAPQTICKLLQNANLAPGVNKKIFDQLTKRAKQMKTQERLCVLLFDEMALAPNVSYNERKDKVTGFVNNGRKTMPEYADHAQVFMIRGLVKNYKQPLSYSFSAAATKGAELCTQIKDIITEVQKAGLIVVATICDQGTNNRHAIKLLLQETRGDFLRSGQEPKDNIIVVNGQEIVPLYDAPHMLKCIRNNLITKNLRFNLDGKSKIAKWEHLELLLKENPGYRGIRLIPKLTMDHIVPSKIPKMKVKYASQVFSKAVANNMGYLADKGILPIDCKETADLLLFFDDLFDSVNGSFGKKSHSKPLLGAVKPNSPHHKKWDEAKKNLRAMQFIDKKSGKTEAVPTLTNWAWTLDGIQILLKNIHSKYGITSVWMRHLNQDPIENYFGAVRSHGCRNTNPTPEKFESAFTTLLLNNMSSVHAIGTNCEKDFCENLHALVISDCEETTTTCDLSEVPDITFTSLDEKKSNPRILAPLQYVCGYFLKKAQTKVFKNCEFCKKELINETAIEYLQYREYTGSRWLCSPSHELLFTVSNMQDVIYSTLKKNLHKQLLKEYLMTLIFMSIDFNFITCQQHKEQVVNFLINISCRFFIYNYCKSINRILYGKRDNEDDEDMFAAKAKNIFYKYSSRKRKLTS